MFETLCSSSSCVVSKLLDLPYQLFFNLCVMIEYYEFELENIKVCQLSAPVVLVLIIFLLTLVIWRGIVKVIIILRGIVKLTM